MTDNTFTFDEFVDGWKNAVGGMPVDVKVTGIPQKYEDDFNFFLGKMMDSLKRMDVYINSITAYEEARND